MGKIKGFLFAVRHRDIIMTDLGLRITRSVKASNLIFSHSPSNFGNLRFGTLSFLCLLFIVVIIFNP